MSRVRKQRTPRSFQATAPAPIVNIAQQRSVRVPLQPGRKPMVFIAVPTEDGLLNYTIAMMFGRAMASTMLEECPFRFAIHVEPGKKGPDYARNCIVKAFLDTDADWLVMIDADQSVPDNFWQLCTVNDADVVSGLTPVWVGNMDDEAMFRVNNYGVDAEGQCFNLPVPDDSAVQPYRVPIVGTGCIAIRRRVFAPKPVGLGSAPFTFTYMDDRKVKAGEDINFGVEANRCGFVVAVHPGVRFGHIKPLDIWQVWAWHKAVKEMEAAGRVTTEKQRLSIG